MQTTSATKPEIKIIRRRVQDTDAIASSDNVTVGIKKGINFLRNTLNPNFPPLAPVTSAASQCPNSCTILKKKNATMNANRKNGEIVEAGSCHKSVSAVSIIVLPRFICQVAINIVLQQGILVMEAMTVCTRKISTLTNSLFSNLLALRRPQSMKNLIKLFIKVGLLFATLANPSHAAAHNVDWRILRTAKQDYFVGTNDSAYEATLGIRCTDPATKQRKLTLMGIPPQATVKMKVDIPKGLQKGDCETAARVGSVVARQEVSPFRLPFSTSHGVCVGQAPGRILTTHVGSNENAIDFWTATGEQIVAAKDGIVFDLMSSSNVGGPHPKFANMANFITILHADGTLAIYAHLMKDSITVERGDRVKVGQPIAKSGATGFAGGPHLHFSVGRPVVDVETQKLGDSYQTIPVSFVIKGKAISVTTLDYLTASNAEGSVEHNRRSCNSAQY